MLLAVNETSCYCAILQYKYLPNNVLSLLLCYSIDSCYDYYYYYFYRWLYSAIINNNHVIQFNIGYTELTWPAQHPGMRMCTGKCMNGWFAHGSNEELFLSAFQSCNPISHFIIPYSGKFSRAQIFANHQQTRQEKNFAIFIFATRSRYPTTPPTIFFTQMVTLSMNFNAKTTVRR